LVSRILPSFTSLPSFLEDGIYENQFFVRGSPLRHLCDFFLRSCLPDACEPFTPYADLCCGISLELCPPPPLRVFFSLQSLFFCTARRRWISGPLDPRALRPLLTGILCKKTFKKQLAISPLPDVSRFSFRLFPPTFRRESSFSLLVKRLQPDPVSCAIAVGGDWMSLASSFCPFCAGPPLHGEDSGFLFCQNPN